MNKDKVKEILEARGVYPTSSIRVTKKEIRWEDEGIPVLPTLLGICEDLGVPPENLKIEHNKGYDGCPTCGYGGECDFDFVVKQCGRLPEKRSD